jgi:hypothetical protein
MLKLLEVSFLKPFKNLKHYRADFTVPDKIEKPGYKFVLICKGIFTVHFRTVIVNLPQDKPGGFSPFETAPQQRSLTISHR